MDPQAKIILLRGALRLTMEMMRHVAINMATTPDKDVLHTTADYAENVLKQTEE